MRALLVAAALAVLPAWSQAQQKIDTARSSIRFVSKQMGAPVEGRFRTFEGTVAFDPARPGAAKAEIDVELASIDLADAEAESEVKGASWFDAGRFPKGRFTLASLKSTAAGKYDASGTLSIKGVSQPVVAPVSLTQSGGQRTIEGQFTLKRLQFRIGEGLWSDLETVADDVLVRFRFAFPAR